MNQEDYLQDLLKYYRPKGFDPFLETHRKGEEGLSYSSWEKYDGQEQIDERSVFPNELVIDIDEGDTEKRREETRQVAQYLENVANYPIIVGDTGGTGFHIHLFFKLPEGEDNHRFWRLALFDLLKEEVRENTQANPEYWDEAPVDFNVDESKGHLIRAFGGRKESTGYRKTTVTTSTLAKEEVEEIEEVNYPALNNRDDVLQINRISDKAADITLKELQEKAREKEEQKEKERKQQYESTYQAEDDGLEALREIPAQEVLKAFFDKDVQPGDSLYCVVHGSDGTGTEEATISDKNTKGMPPGRYGCFGDSCKESGETIHWHNAIDLLTEGLNMDFQEAKQELAEEFDVDLDETTEGTEVTDAKDPGRFFKQPEARRGFQPNKLAKDIEKDFEFVFNKMQEQLYYYDGGVYRDDGARLVKEECNRRLQDEFKMSRVNDTLNAIKTRPGVAKSKKEFRPPEYKINFQNGVYDLMEEKLVSHSEDYYFTSQIPHDYNPDADGTNVKEFFREVTESEEEAKTLMELSGFTMMPSMPISAAFLLVGKGDNGKTVFLNTLRELIGEEHAKDEDLQQLEHTRFGTSSLYRKLLVVSDDMPSTELETGGTLKGITGGGQVRAEFKGGDHFEFKNYATPVFACNDVPETEDQSDGFFRRWTIIDFPYKFTENPEQSFEKQKKTKFQLKKELLDEEEQESYAYQAVQALHDVLERQGFAAQKPAEETRQKWNGYANPVMEFIYKYIEQGVTYNEAQRKAKQKKDKDQTTITSYDFDFVPKDELFDLVSAYAEARNARPPENKTELKKKLDKADFYFSTARTTQTEFEEGQTQVYRGIKYSDEFEKLLEESESLQEFQGKLEILSVSGRMPAHTNVEMRIEKNHANPARIEAEDSDDSSEPARPQKEVLEILEDLDAVGRNSPTVSFSELSEMTGLENLHDAVEELISNGEIEEPKNGEFRVRV